MILRATQGGSTGTQVYFLFYEQFNRTSGDRAVQPGILSDDRSPGCPLIRTQYRENCSSSGRLISIFALRRISVLLAPTKMEYMPFST